MRNGLIYTFFTLWAVAALWVTAKGFRPFGEPSCALLPQEDVVLTEDKVLRTGELIVVGDIMAHLPQVDAARVRYEHYDFGPHFEGVGGLFAEADYVVGNLETTLSPRPPYGGYPTFATPEELAHDMRRSGFDCVTIANNHSADRGVGGLLSTVAALDNAGIDYVGARAERYAVGRTEPLVCYVGDFDVALLAYTYGANGPVPAGVELNLLDTTTMRRHIESVRQRVDCVVALVHWGVEYALRPNGEQRRLAEWMRGAGVDVVVGSHPHVAQPYEVWHDAEGRSVGGVFYSLGNFISNQNSPYTDWGLAACLSLRQQGLSEPELTIRADTIRRLRYNEGGRLRYGLEVQQGS